MKKAYFFAGVSILFWSTLATVSKLLLHSFDSIQVLMCSCFFAFASLLIVNIIKGNLKALKNYKPKDYLITTLICLPGTFLYYVFLYLGTARMSASQAFIINYLWPIMSVIFACIILKEKLNFRKCIAIAFSFLGVITVAGEELTNFNSNTFTGVILCILAAVCYGLFTALNSKYNYDYMLSMMIAFLIAFVLSLILNLFTAKPFSANFLQTLGFAYNGIFIMAIATVTWALALKQGSTAKISNLAYVTPFLSLLWTFLILNEPIKPLSVLGLVIIIIGIFIQLKKE